MFKIQTLNKIDPNGLKLFPLDKYEIASELPNPDAIVLRSFKMHDMELSSSVKAIARAGAGPAPPEELQALQNVRQRVPAVGRRRRGLR